MTLSEFIIIVHQHNPLLEESYHHRSSLFIHPFIKPYDSFICLLSIVLLLQKFHINKIIQYVLEFSPFELTMFLRFVHVVWCVFCSLLMWHSIVQIYSVLFIHWTADGHSDYFQYLAIMNNAAINSCVEIHFVDTSFHFSW